MTKSSKTTKPAAKPAAMKTRKPAQAAMSQDSVLDTPLTKPATTTAARPIGDIIRENDAKRIAAIAEKDPKLAKEMGELMNGTRKFASLDEPGRKEAAAGQGPNSGNDLYARASEILAADPATELNVLAGKLKTNIGTAQALLRQFRGARREDPAELRRPLDDAPDKDRLREAIEAAGFAFVASDGGADGFQHGDGRAATVKDGRWALRHPDGSASQGRTPRALEIELAMSPRLAPEPSDDAGRMTDLAAAASKKRRVPEPPKPAAGDEETLPHAYHGTGAKCAVCFKAAADGPHVAEEATTVAEDLSAARAGRAMPAPANVVRAVEMLGYHTGATFDLSKMGGDKRYGQRVAMLKKLLCATKVLVKDSGPRQLGDAFHSAVGAKGKNAGAKAADFAARCKAMLAAATRAKSAETRATTKAKAFALAAAKPGLSVAGDVLPAYVKPSKAERAEELEATLRELELAVSEPVAAPRPGAEVELVAGEVWLLEDMSNRIVMLCLERPNSQGAVCVYNNGTRVAVGVVPREVLVKMRQVQDVDPVSAARELLNPTTPGVAVTPTAARHLQAVSDCKELTMPNTKKFAAKKQAAKAEKPAKAAKAKKEPTERKSSLFRLKNDTKKTWEAFQTQKGELIAAFVKLGAVGAKATGATRAQLVAALPKIDPKNISFYLSKWQPDILEKLAPAE